MKHSKSKSKSKKKNIESDQALDIIKYISLFTLGTISAASLYAFYFKNEKNKIYKMIDKSTERGIRFIDIYFLFYIKFIEAIQTNNQKFIDEIVEALKYSEKVKEKQENNINFNFFSLTDLDKHKKKLKPEEIFQLNLDSYSPPLFYCIKTRNVNLFKTLVDLYGDSILVGSEFNNPIILDLLSYISNSNQVDKDLDKMFDFLINPKYDLRIFSTYYKSRKDMFDIIMTFKGRSDNYLIKIMRYIECRFNRKITYNNNNDFVFVKNNIITNKYLNKEEEKSYHMNFKYLFNHHLFKSDYYKDVIYNNFIKNN